MGRMGQILAYVLDLQYVGCPKALLHSQERHGPLFVYGNLVFSRYYDLE